MEFLELSKKELSEKEFPLEELQHYALIRLLRKAAEAQKLLNAIQLIQSFIFFQKLILTNIFQNKNVLFTMRNNCKNYNKH